MMGAFHEWCVCGKICFKKRVVRVRGNLLQVLSSKRLVSNLFEIALNAAEDARPQSEW